MKRSASVILCLLILAADVVAENFRASVVGTLTVAAGQPEGASLALSYLDSALIELEANPRFLRGVELLISVPSAYQTYRGSLLVTLYPDMPTAVVGGVMDLTGDRAGSELLPNKLQVIYQIPLRKNHNLKASPYVSLPFGWLSPDRFPALFRLQPVIKGLPEELENLKFQLTAKPLLSDEGAVALTIAFPPSLRGRPFTLLIDDSVLPSIDQELLLKEGEHFLTIISDDYRNETRHFQIERAKVLPLIIELHDPTPLVAIEAPANAVAYFDDNILADLAVPFPAPPGEHVIRFQVGDYTVAKTIVLRQGKTYRVALSIDVAVSESE